ncbi:MAG: aspartate aminotransferase family protein [Phycisphaerales bacterium]|nr:aspartate aminotransferase family protein [Phycisphaerales bacterium]
MKPTTQEEIIATGKAYTFLSFRNQSLVDMLAIEKGKGVFVYDYEGKKYLDFTAVFGNMNIGHGDQRVTEAVVKQMQKLAHVNNFYATTEVVGALGKKIASITPGDLQKVFFTVCGATAIENSIKIARHYTKKHKILSRYTAYHGATYGAMTVGGDSRKTAHDAQQIPNVVHFEDPFCYRCPFGKELGSCQYECLGHLERIIKFENPNTIAAILVEGSSSAPSGQITYPPNYLKTIRKLCDKYNILMIADEVYSGFGRTGKWFGVDHEGVVPDIMAIAKGLSSGYIPLGGVVLRESIARFYDNQVFWQGLTYSNHPVACAAALEVIKIYEDDKLIENAEKMGQYLRQELLKLKNNNPCIGDVRGLGLSMVIDLVKNKQTKEPFVDRYDTKQTDQTVALAKFNKLMVQEGLLIGSLYAHLFIAPPLCINKDEIDYAIQIINKGLPILNAVL